MIHLFHLVNNFLESLGREIFVQIYLGNRKKYYNEEIW